MESIDVVAIARLDADERARKMGELFEGLLKMPEEEQKQALSALIRDMAERGSDEAYLALCQTNLALAASLPDTVFHDFLALRMKVSAELPGNLAARDASMLKEAVTLMPKAVQEKIGRPV